MSNCELVKSEPTNLATWQWSGTDYHGGNAEHLIMQAEAIRDIKVCTSNISKLLTALIANLAKVPEQLKKAG